MQNYREIEMIESGESPEFGLFSKGNKFKLPAETAQILVERKLAKYTENKITEAKENGGA